MADNEKIKTASRDNGDKRSSKNENCKTERRISGKSIISAIIAFLMLYLIAKVIIYPDFYFDFGSFVERLSEFPQIDLQSILLWDSQADGVLGLLLGLGQSFVFILGAIANSAIFLISFLQFLFL